MKTIQKIRKTNKAVQQFLQQLLKNYISMKNKIKKIWLCLALLSVTTACGSTKVAVSRPAEGTSTTITVTTNNPITTNVNPETNATLWDKK